jgi:hypothetical protein
MKRKGLAWLLGVFVSCLAVFTGTSTLCAEDTAPGIPGISSPEPQTPSLLRDVIKDLSVSGFFRETAGFFINTEAISPTRSKNSLSTLRQFLQLDFNYTAGEHNSFFMRDWFVYEPAYPFENTATIKGSNTHDFYNQFGVREAWWRNQTGPVVTFVGRQIVMWGSSVAFRIGDVINPQDFSYAFGFANLEESRMPIFMVHPILNLPNFRALSNSYLEVIYAPGADPLYTQVDYPDDRFEGQNTIAGRVNVLAPAGARFAVRPPQGPGGSSIVAQGRVFPPIKTRWVIPRATWDNSQVGVRLHTILENETDISLFYWRSHEYSPIVFVRNPHLISFEFRPFQGVGGTIQRPIYLPGALNQLFPIVLRGEFFYKNHAAFDTVDLSAPFGVVYSDTFNHLIAMDITSAYVPQLSRTGSLTVNLEYQGLTILDSNKNMLASGAYRPRVYKNDTNFALNVGESWWNGAIAPVWTSAFNPAGKTLLLFPSFTFIPPWTNSYFLKTQYIGIFGDNKYYGGGVFKGKSMFVFSFQYNFNLL